jgi:hypothetical protein
MAYAFIIEPHTYHSFDNEDELMDKCKAWGLLSEKATKTKAFYYKGNGMSLDCNIIGFVDDVTAVIEFENKQQHCIHPSYLKEMQASSFSQRLTSAAEDTAEPKGGAAPAAEKSPKAEELPEAEGSTEAAEAPKKAKKEKKAAATKVQLPEEKVKMTATVKEFTTVPNHFSDDDDEVIIYDEVFITDPETEIGSAWSSHSATIKKVELEIGDTITFEAKIAKKKLTRHPVPYKINNPSKMQKV